MYSSDFLIIAENYADARGDYDRFVDRYSDYREFSNVKDSTWLAIKDMYGEDTADLLEKMV